MFEPVLPEVYTPRDVAHAAGVPESQIRGLLASGEIRSLAARLPAASDRPRWSQLIAHDDAVRAVRAIRAGGLTLVPSARGSLLAPAPAAHRPTTVPLLVSTSLHAAIVALALVIASLDLTNADERTEVLDAATRPVRLVFLVQPGPGGGGGGGGMKTRTPPPKAARQGRQAVSNPIPVRRVPPPIQPAPVRVEPPPVPLEAKTLPPVMAPVAPVAADDRNQEGQLREAPKDAPPSQGPGTGGGTGTGQGTGLGEGSGSGIGPGEGGGTGGGPYRPGSGVEPPRLLKEVRADYTDQARRANLTGEVVLEIVVRRDGTVGDVRVLQRLGAGLDERAIQAVRQWRFAPARLRGAPVDVIVEVGVEFKLR